MQSLRGETDALLLIDLADDAFIVVDWGRKDYWWRGSSADFPESPTVSKVRLFRGDGARLPFMLEQPSELSALMWLVGLNAFRTGPAWWLGEGMRYRLSRWPDFTMLAHDLDDVNMTALLSKGALSVNELASASGVEPMRAQRLINALSLMGQLREVVAGPPVETARVETAPVSIPVTRGLFKRLRARLGV